MQVVLCTEKGCADWARGKTTSDGYEWHHMVMVFDGPSKRLEFYFNGTQYPCPAPKGKVEVGGKHKWVDNIFPEAWQIKAAASKIPLVIGKQAAGGPNACQAIDEVMIWDRALSEEEVKGLYNNGLGVSLRAEGKPKLRQGRSRLRRIQAYGGLPVSG